MSRRPPEVGEELSRRPPNSGGGGGGDGDGEEGSIVAGWPAGRDWEESSRLGAEQKWADGGERRAWARGKGGRRWREACTGERRLAAGQFVSGARAYV